MRRPARLAAPVAALLASSVCSSAVDAATGCEKVFGIFDDVVAGPLDADTLSDRWRAVDFEEGSDLDAMVDAIVAEMRLGREGAVAEITVALVRRCEDVLGRPARPS